MWIAIVVLWLIAALFIWAIIYGGSKNDPNRYDDTYPPLNKEDQEEWRLLD